MQPTFTKRWTFEYAPGLNVTVRAASLDIARQRAAKVMDRRYEAKGKEPPVAWTLTLISEEVVETQRSRRKRSKQ